MTTPHNYFGSMILDERQRTYRATLDLSPSRKVSITIDWARISPSEALIRSRDICERVRARETEYRTKIAQTLLSLYNDTWRDGAALDADGFVQKIFLSEMQICPIDFGTGSCVTLGYADGDLFAGHYIEVFLDADFNYVTSQIAG
jgi:hypothetical protein